MRSGIFGAIGSRMITIPGLVTKSFEGLYYAVGCNKPSSLIEQSAFIETNNETFGIHGVWLNSENHNWSESDSLLHLKEYVNDPSKFDQIEGPVQGFHFDKSAGRLLLHTDFARQHPLFYYEGDGLFAYAYSLDLLVKILRENNVTIDADYQAASMLLTFASILGHKTLVKGINKLMPGHSAEWTRNSLRCYPRSNPLDIDRDISNPSEAIEMIDTSFREASNRMIHLNQAFGKGQINLLSGGIDSRMVFLQTATETEKVKCLCFSAEDYLDHKISKSIAKDYGAEYLFHNLNQGEYMLNTDSVEEYDGTINYLASAHHRHALRSLRIPNPGLIASGQLGNEILAEFGMPNATFESVVSSIHTYSKAFGGCRDEVESLWNNTPDSTVFKLYNRGFLYTNSAAFSTRPHGILYSPFTSSSFVRSALRIQPDLLANHKIYLEWMRSCYPEATKYDWERYRAKPIQGVRLNAAKLKMNILSRFVYPISSFRGASMSPIQLWYNESKTHQEFFHRAFVDKREFLDSLPELASLVDSNYSTMSVMNKASVLTLLIGLEKYIN